MSDQDKTAGRKGRAPRRSREPDAAPQQYMLDDHPFLVPVLVVIFSGICVYFTLFTDTVREALIGTHPTSEVLGQYNTGIGWVIAAGLAILLLSFIFLVLNTVSHAFRVRKRQPVTCPQCGTTEPRYGAWKRDRVKETVWNEVTCPNCGNKWYSKVQ